MRLILILLVVSICYAATPILKVEAIHESYTDKPKHGFFDNESNPKVIGYVGAKGYMDNIEYKIVLSNKYDDTVFDTFAFNADYREDKFLYGSKFGTISTLKGVFDLTKGTDEQAPLIGGENAIYTNRLRKAGFEQNVGVEPYVGFLFKGSIIKVRYLYSHMRILSEKKMDVGILGYNSSDTEIEVSKPFQGAGMSLLWGDFTFFYDDVITSLKLKTDLNDNEILTKYLSNTATFDYALMAAGKGETDINIVRYGLTKQNADYLLGYEHIYYNQKNLAINLDKGNYADNIYLAWYGLNHVVFYGMYGESMRLKDGKEYGTLSQEKVIGLRKTLNDNISVLGEYRITDWWQTYNMMDYQENRQYFEEEKPIKMYSMMLIYKY